MATKKSAAKPAYGFGWLPDLPDQRDVLYSAPLTIIRKLPAKVDLRTKCPPVYDQGQLGSCTANALGGAFEFGQKKQKKKDFMPSRLFIYYNERVLNNSVNSDSGAFIRDGIKTLNKQGVCPEKEWTYDDDNSPGAKFSKKPPAKCYTDATKNQITSYQRLVNTNLFQLQSCLSEGYPFVFGFTVYQSFMNIGKDGMMPMPKTTESILGGHAVMAVGYDATKQVFIIRNSWGKSWAVKGYFYMPFSYITDANKADDFWTIRMVE